MTIPALSVSEFEEATKYDSLIADCRAQLDFINGFIPQSVYVFPAFFKYAFLKKKLQQEIESPFFLVAEIAETEEKAQWLETQSGKSIEAYLENGFSAWKEAAEAINIIVSIEPDEIMMDMKYSQPRIVDIRSEAAFASLHIEGAEHVEAESLLEGAAKLKPEDVYYLYCEDGNLSLSVISLLKREGYHNFYHLQGGFKALFEAEASMVKGV